MKNIFGDKKFIIGMVHLDPLPGAPLYKDNLSKVYEKAMKDANSLKEGGISAIMVENAGDAPFPKKLDMSQVACLATITSQIKKRTNLPVGIDAVFCDYKAALASAMAAEADFVRLAVYVDTVVTGSGIIEACSELAVRYRKKIGAEKVAIFADVQVKYSHLLVDKIDIKESAKNAESALADAIIVTGAYSGNETPIEVVKQVKEVVSVPIIIGSGLTVDNVATQMKYAEGAIVGTSLKSTINGEELIDSEKVKQLMKELYEKENV